MANTNTHTPGPWLVSQTNPADFPNNYWIMAGSHGWVDGTYMAVSGPIGFANASLIAAAPDLLEALESILDGGIASPSEVTKAYIAIDKAKGL